MGWKVIDSSGNIKTTVALGVNTVVSANITDGTIVAADIADDTITEAKLAAGATLQIATLQLTNSGTAIDFTGIPAGTKEIRITLANVSTDGAGSLMIRLGDAGGFEDADYASTSFIISNGAAVVSTDDSTSFRFQGSSDANSISGIILLTLNNPAGFLWACAGTTRLGNTAYSGSIAGWKATSAELTSIRLTNAAGDTFDGGQINIAYK